MNLTKFLPNISEGFFILVGLMLASFIYDILRGDYFWVICCLVVLLFDYFWVIKNRK